MIMTPQPRRKRKPPAADEDLAVIWSDVRAQPVRRRVVLTNPLTAYELPPIEPVIRWTLTFHEPPSSESPRTSMLVVPGPTAHERLQFYRRYTASEWDSFRPDTIEDVVNDNARDWVDETIIENLTRRIAAARIPPSVRKGLPAWFPPPTHGWELLWALISTENFVIEEPLRAMVDQPHYLIHHLYRALWEFRFALKENKSFEPAAHIYFATTRWMTGSNLSPTDLQVLSDMGITRRVQHPTERFDMLLFLVTLAAQNGLLNRMTLCFDGLERATKPEKRPLLRELDHFLATVDRWVKLTHIPIGILVGFGASERELAQLKTLNPKLAERVKNGLAWVKPR